MSRLIAGIVVVIAIVAGAVGAYIYISSEMEIGARRAIANAGMALFGDPSRGKIEFGAVNVDVLGSRVDISDIVISIDGHPVGTIAAGHFGVERFTGRLGDIELVSLRRLGPIPGISKGPEGEIKRVVILEPGTDAAQLLAQAARREIDAATFIEKISFSRIAVEGVDTKVDGPTGRDAHSLASLVIDRMAGGRIKRLAVSGMRATSGVRHGHLRLDKLEINDLDLGRIARAAASKDPAALFGSMVLSGFTMENIEIGTADWRFSLARARLASQFAKTDKGELYANGSTIEIHKMVLPLLSRDAAERAIIEKLGLDAVETEIGMTFSGDHKNRTMTLDDFKIVVKELAGLQLRYRILDVPEEAYTLGMTRDKLQGMYGKLGAAKLERASLVVTNMRLIPVLLDEWARAARMTRDRFIDDLARRARAEPRYGRSGAVAGLVDKFVQFLRDPKVIRISAAPSGGLRFDRVLALYMTDPGQLIAALNLQVTVN